MQLKLSFDCKDTSWSPSSTWVKCYFRRYLMRINPFDKNGNVICFCQTVYGPDAPQKFQYLGYKYNLDYDDVFQIASLTYLEKIYDYKPNIGTLPAFLFGHLIWAIRRYIDPVLKYAISIDDD